MSLKLIHMLDMLFLQYCEDVIILVIILPTKLLLTLLYTSSIFSTNLSLTFCHMLDTVVLKSFEKAISFRIVLPTKLSLNLLYTSIAFCVNVSFTFCHKLVILSRKFTTNPATAVMILPMNEFLTNPQTIFIAPRNICLTPSHIFEKSLVNIPLKILTAPIIMSSAPVMITFMLSHTVLMISSTNGITNSITTFIVLNAFFI